MGGNYALRTSARPHDCFPSPSVLSARRHLGQRGHRRRGLPPVASLSFRARPLEMVGACRAHCSDAHQSRSVLQCSCTAATSDSAQRSWGLCSRSPGSSPDGLQKPVMWEEVHDACQG